MYRKIWLAHSRWSNAKVTINFYDDREDSPTLGNYQEIVLSTSNYYLITIPPNIWNGFKGLASEESIIANCLTLPHNEKEMVRKDSFDKYFKYNWKQ